MATPVPSDTKWVACSAVHRSAWLRPPPPVGAGRYGPLVGRGFSFLARRAQSPTKLPSAVRFPIGKNGYNSLIVFAVLHSAADFAKKKFGISSVLEGKLSAQKRYPYDSSWYDPKI